MSAQLSITGSELVITEAEHAELIRTCRMVETTFGSHVKLTRNECNNEAIIRLAQMRGLGGKGGKR